MNGPAAVYATKILVGAVIGAGLAALALSLLSDRALGRLVAAVFVLGIVASLWVAVYAVVRK